MKRLLALILCVLLSLSLVSVAFAAETKDHSAYTGDFRMVGPGVFAAVGEDGIVDPVTGIMKPGYKDVMGWLQEEFPNVNFMIDASSWDSWQAKIQAAAAGKQVDLVLHGAAVLDVCEDLTPYIEADPWLADVLYLPHCVRHRDEQAFDVNTPTGIQFTLSPAMMMIDKKIFEDFGVVLPPPQELTWDVLLDIIPKVTGTNPVTGEQNYGVFPFAVSDTSIYKNLSNINWGLDITVFDYAPNKFDTKFYFTSEEEIAALTKLANMAKSAPKAYLEGLGNEFVGTEDSNIAIVMDESNNFITKYNNTVIRGIQDRFAYVPLPISDDGTHYTSHSGDNNLAIAKNSDNKELAWEVIKFLVTDDRVQQWLVDAMVVPNNKEGMEKLLSTENGYAESIKMIYEVYPPNFEIFSCQYWNNGFGTSNSVGSSNLAELFAGNITPEECASNIQYALEEYNDLNR